MIAARISSLHIDVIVPGVRREYPNRFQQQAGETYSQYQREFKVHRDRGSRLQVIPSDHRSSGCRVPFIDLWWSHCIYGRSQLATYLIPLNSLLSSLVILCKNWITIRFRLTAEGSSHHGHQQSIKMNLIPQPY
jgi:hypothetical protein